jgi:hypothetical protein
MQRRELEYGRKAMHDNGAEGFSHGAEVFQPRVQDRHQSLGNASLNCSSLFAGTSPVKRNKNACRFKYPGMDLFDLESLP